MTLVAIAGMIPSIMLKKDRIRGMIMTKEAVNKALNSMKANKIIEEK
jgi:hypothetical protein